MLAKAKGTVKILQPRGKWEKCQDFASIFSTRLLWKMVSHGTTWWWVHFVWSFHRYSFDHFIMVVFLFMTSEISHLWSFKLDTRGFLLFGNPSFYFYILLFLYKYYATIHCKPSVFSSVSFTLSLMQYLRLYYPSSLHMSFEALSLMFTNAFTELAAMDRPIKIGREPIFNLIPVVGAGSSSTSMNDIITCELLARKHQVWLLYLQAFMGLNHELYEMGFTRTFENSSKKSKYYLAWFGSMIQETVAALLHDVFVLAFHVTQMGKLALYSNRFNFIFYDWFDW